jgi:hypothetical protein
LQQEPNKLGISGGRRDIENFALVYAYDVHLQAAIHKARNGPTVPRSIVAVERHPDSYLSRTGI